MKILSDILNEIDNGEKITCELNKEKIKNKYHILYGFVNFKKELVRCFTFNDLEHMLKICQEHNRQVLLIIQ